VDVSHTFLIFTALDSSLNKYIMGKGDQKSRRGKIHIGSHGTRRPRKKSSYKLVAAVPKGKESKEQVAAVTPQKAEVAESVVPLAEGAAEIKKAVRKSVKKAKDETSPE
jgi:30S ribosomal protein S31